MERYSWQLTQFYRSECFIPKRTRDIHVPQVFIFLLLNLPKSSLMIRSDFANKETNEIMHYSDNTCDLFECAKVLAFHSPEDLFVGWIKEFGALTKEEGRQRKLCCDFPVSGPWKKLISHSNINKT